MPDVLENLASALVAAGTAVFAAFAVAALARASHRVQPHSLSTTEGRITPGKKSAAAVVALGLLLAFSGLVLVFRGEWMSGVALTVVGLPLAGFMAPSLTHCHDVLWNADGIEGPSRTLGPTLGLSRTFIRWPDVISVGETKTNYWFIESRDGRRIHWSYLYRGYGAFEDQLQKRCHALRSET